MNLDELLDTPEVSEQTPIINPPEGIVKDNSEDTSAIEGEEGGLNPESINEKSQGLNEIESQSSEKLIPAIPPPIPSKDDIESERESTRKGMAFFLLGVLGFTVASTLIFIPLGKAFFISKYPDNDVEKVEKILDKDTINLIWTSQVTLIGTVLGFYFGNESNSNDD